MLTADIFFNQEMFQFFKFLAEKKKNFISKLRGGTFLVFFPKEEKMIEKTEIKMKKDLPGVWAKNLWGH